MISGKSQNQPCERLNWENRRVGTVLWLMGPTSAGKTTLAMHLVTDLRRRDVLAVCYDGDEVRNLFGSRLGFGAEERLLVVSALVHLANKAADAGLHVVVSALTTGQSAREYIRANVQNLTVGYVSCSIETCIRRDPKGLYKKAIQGEIDSLIGYNGEYLPPDSPDFTLDTEQESLEELTARLLSVYSVVGHGIAESRDARIA